jgi:hypothetical protein
MRISVAVFLVLCVPLLALPEAGPGWETMEETGESGQTADAPRYDGKVDAPRGQVLLIPDSNADVVAMFDPYDGTYWGDFIVDDPTGTLYDFQTPINAMQISPGGPVLVSDQVSDAVYGFDSNGNFMYVVGDAANLNNVRGIDFRDDTVYVTSGDDYVAMFDAPGSFVGYFIQDGTDPFDIMFIDEVESGSALYCDIQGTTDNVRHYHADGTLIGELFSINFPEQVQVDILNPGYYLAIGFSENMIYQFTIDGTITDSWSFSGGRGIFRLGNGNLLATNGTGVQELDAATGSIIEIEYSGSGRFIELADLPGVAIGETSFQGIPAPEMTLHPNPFQDQLSIGFTLTEPSDVRVDIYSVVGRIVRTMEPGTLGSGSHTLTWDGTSDGGTSLGRGVYFVRMTTSTGMTTMKVHLLR